MSSAKPSHNKSSAHMVRGSFRTANPDPALSGRRWPRKTLSCESCRRSKLRCDRQLPCSNCRRRGCVASCTYRQNTARTTKAAELYGHLTAPNLSDSGAPHIDSVASLDVVPPASSPTEADDGQVSTRPPQTTDNVPSDPNCWDDMLQRPTPKHCGIFSGESSQEFPLTFGPMPPVAAVLASVPPAECCDYLVSRYFMHLAPLFSILHGPTFQSQYMHFQRDHSQASFSWLALLFTVCSMGLLTVEPNDAVVTEWLSKEQSHQSHDTLALSRSLRRLALTCLSHDQFLVHHDLHTLEASLLLIYSICHDEGVERSWVLLGMALNMAIALKCSTGSGRDGDVTQERRRRCWAGVLTLHTYQGILYRDVDNSFLLQTKEKMLLDFQQLGSTAVSGSSWSISPGDLGLMEYKIRLFQLSTRLCCQVSKPPSGYNATLKEIDRDIAAEQQLWDEALLVGGFPSVLDTASYAHWCILQTYAHQLYLIIHRPFHRSSSPEFRPKSREMCLRSGRALLDLHRQFCDLPRLRSYRWLVHGMTTFNALQGSVALASCLLDLPGTADTKLDYEALDAMVERMRVFQKRSPVCMKTYPIVRHLRDYLKDRLDRPATGISAETDALEGWLEFDWFSSEAENWLSWEGFLNSPPTAGEPV